MTEANLDQLSVNTIRTLTIDAVPGGDVASPSQTGLLLMYRDSKSEKEASAITVH